MNMTITPLRRLGATVAIAGFAALGSVAIAPAASAAPATEAVSADSPIVQDGPASVVERSGGNGPDAFIVFEHGVKPVFFCDEDKPKKHKNKCEPVVVNGPRF